jgi:hypothetical protein
MICGVMRSVMPTSCRSMVVNRFERFELDVARLATNGTFRPTTISASSLSVVTMFGDESTFTSRSCWSAVSSSVYAGTCSPDGSVIMWLLAAARMRPGSDVGSVATEASELVLSCPSAAPLPVPVAPRNSTPSARSLSVVTSRMIASTKTWRRRTSSSAITLESVSQSSGVAETMSALVAGSAVIRTGASSGIVAAVPVLAGSGRGGGSAGVPLAPS